VRQHSRYLDGTGANSLLLRRSQRSLIKSIQSGTTTIAINTTTNTSTVTAVVVANSVLLNLGSTHSNAAETNAGRWNLRISLTNTTTITATNYASGPASTPIVSWMLVEFLPGVIKTRQEGTIALTTVASATATVTAVTVQKSALFPIGWSGGADPAVGEGATARLAVTNATTITATKIGTSAVIPMTVGYQLVEFF